MVLGSTNTVNLISTTDTPDLASQAECETGSRVNGLYLKVEVSSTSGTALNNLYMLIFKNPGGNLTAPAPNAVGVSDNKKYCIHQEMVMLQKFDADVSSNPRILFNGVIAIPKLYRRNGPNDLLQLLTLSPGSNNDLCIQCHYKEFR